MNTKDALRLTLIDLMDETGTSGSELAEYLGVTKQAVSNWRSGNAGISVDHIPQICKYFDITYDDFFGKNEQVLVLSDEEREIIDIYRCVSPQGQAAIMTLIHGIEEKFGWERKQ